MCSKAVVSLSRSLTTLRLLPTATSHCSYRTTASIDDQLVPTSQQHLSSTIEKQQKFVDRDDLKHSKRVIIKLGSAALTRSDQGGIALGSLASIVEQAAEMHADGRDVMIVTSGAVAFGKQRLTREWAMSQSVRDTIRGTYLNKPLRTTADKKSCAAVGQSGLMSLYESMFFQYGITTAQVLVSTHDLNSSNSQHLKATLDSMMGLSIIPIINTNDAVVPLQAPQQDSLNALSITDNDSLSARLAALTDTDLLIMMSNVDGLYSAPPGSENAKLIHTYSTANSTNEIEFGAKSTVGLGGMDSKVEAAVWAVEHGTSAVVCNGCERNTNVITDIVGGKKVGTFFTQKPDQDLNAGEKGAHDLAQRGSRNLQLLDGEQRRDILMKMAELLEEREDEIMSANHRDVMAARKKGDLSQPLMDRLILSPGRLRQLAEGVREVANQSASLVGKVLLRRQLSKGLVADQVSVPIGVVLIIFESRPDCLPQIASLAIATGNGILAKGGKESSHTNAALHSLVRESLSLYNCEDASHLIQSRDEVGNLIEDSKGKIDLIIPRGSSQMVRGIQQVAAGTGVPVLGHSEGVCHVYVDHDCSSDMACRIVQDAKCNYPAACNAMETLLIHKDLLHTSVFKEINDVLLAEGVKVNLGPKLAARVMFSPSHTVSLKTEYSSLECCIELVDGVEDAINHIKQYGSSHTDTIVTNNGDTAELFLRSVDSACVFHNCSTRFADGQRMGLGAEVGVSTTRIHARGPVGAEGLLTYKWVVRGEGQAVRDFSEGGTCVYDHQLLPVVVDDDELD